MRFLRTALTLAAVVCTGAPVARAQDAFDSPPPHLSIVEGAATLDREDFSEPATGGAPLVPGDRVRTERGRAEILFPDGSAIDLDEFTSIEFDAPTLMRLTNGRILLSIAGSANPAAALQFQIDTPVASAQTDGPGEYRVSMLGGPSGLQTEMAIVRGAGALVTEAGTMPLRAGERSVAWDNAAPSQPQYFNAARFDAFDQWALGLRDQRLGSRSQSAQYLPADLRIYGGELDRYGSWGYEASYGNVWYPSVGPDWRPYYDGYWSSVPTYGWTWIGVDVWSWPTHHYGRWGYGRNRWFWIPDRRWAPAWVSARFRQPAGLRAVGLDWQPWMGRGQLAWMDRRVARSLWWTAKRPSVCGLAAIAALERRVRGGAFGASRSASCSTPSRIRR